MSKRILFLFVDGIGLGANNPETNPFAVAKMPTLKALSNGKGWYKDTGLQESSRALFIPTDPRLGIAGRPQSGSSQAAILTGRNVPQEIGRHYGPLPNEPIRAILNEGNFFMEAKAQGLRTALIDAYPAQRLDGIESGMRLPSSIQYAAIAAGQRLFTKEDLVEGRALTAEYTGYPWRDHLGIEDIPFFTPYEAGKELVRLSRDYAFSFHSQWMTDWVGHRGTMEQAVELIETLDEVIRGLLDAWDDDEGLVLVTSDHGNMEEMDNRKHTEADVPTLVIGRGKNEFAEGFSKLTDFVPAMRRYLFT
jgi:2,3-bisphosphoglycerate-independent phosphoglycerate mutase